MWGVTGGPNSIVACPFAGATDTGASLHLMVNFAVAPGIIGTGFSTRTTFVGARLARLDHRARLPHIVATYLRAGSTVVGAIARCLRDLALAPDAVVASHGAAATIVATSAQFFDDDAGLPEPGVAALHSSSTIVLATASRPRFKTRFQFRKCRACPTRTGPNNRKPDNTKTNQPKPKAKICHAQAYVDFDSIQSRFRRARRHKTNGRTGERKGARDWLF